jgi:hypothetical protein
MGDALASALDELLRTAGRGGLGEKLAMARLRHIAGRLAVEGARVDVSVHPRRARRRLANPVHVVHSVMAAVLSNIGEHKCQ